jgi:hypothetical protein
MITISTVILIIVFLILTFIAAVIVLYPVNNRKPDPLGVFLWIVFELLILDIFFFHFINWVK